MLAIANFVKTMNSNQELFDLSYKALEEQKDRFNNASERGSKLIPGIVILTTAYCFFIKEFLLSGNIPPSETHKKILWVVFGIMFISLVSAFFFTIQSLSLRKFRHVTLNPNIITLLKDKPSNEARTEIIRLNNDAITSNIGTLKNKNRELNISIGLIKIFIILFLLIVFYNYLIYTLKINF